MSGNLNESAIETLAIDLFKRQGYSYIYGLDIAPDGPTSERSRYEDVILTARLEQALRRINPTVSPDQLQAALKDFPTHPIPRPARQ